MTGAKAKKRSKGKQTKPKPITGEPTGGRQVTGKPPHRRWPWFAWLFIALAIAGVIVAIRIYPVVQPPPDSPGKPRAAIVDQLYNLRENRAFVANVTGELENLGFEVDLYQGDITVDFYRGLPAHGYKLIIMRAHSGLMIQNGEVLPTTLLFTNEEYDRRWYPLEQLDDRLAMGTAGPDHPVLFGITPKFVTESMKSEFNDTVIILMGCGGIYLTDLAEAFVEKGASAYLAWHSAVNLRYVDEATPYLMGQLCSEKATIKEAVDSTMNVIGPDPEYGAELRYYPAESGDKTLKELLQIAFNREDSISSPTG